MEYDGKHKYQVIVIDEWNNMYLIGFFDTLKEAEPEVNDFIKDYKVMDDEDEKIIFTPKFGPNERLGELKEYPSTLGYCFDRELGTEEGCLQIRGFCF